MQSHSVTKCPLAILVLVAVTAMGCTTQPVDDPPLEIVPAPQVPTFEPSPPDLPSQAYEDRSSNILRNDFMAEHIEDMASFDVIVLSLTAIFTDDGAANIARIRRLNPDVIVLGLHQVLARHQAWDDPEVRALFPFAAEQGDLWAPHLLETLAGEPAMMWSQSQMIDPTDGGTSMSRELLVEHVNMIARYAQKYPGAIDGFYHEYMSTSPWLYPDGPVAGTTEDVDLDHDGVGAQSDPDDIAIWRQWQRELLRELQGRFGPGLVQVANGDLGIRDEEAAGLMAGIVYQHFPRTVWGYTDLFGLEMAIDHSRNRLTPRRGRIWSLLESEAPFRVGDVRFRRVASLLTGLPYVNRSSRWGDYWGRDPVGVDLGMPTGALQRLDLPGGGVRYERPFQNGTARIDFDSNGTQLFLAPMMGG